MTYPNTVEQAIINYMRREAQIHMDWRRLEWNDTALAEDAIDQFNVEDDNLQDWIFDQAVDIARELEAEEQKNYEAQS